MVNTMAGLTLPSTNSTWRFWVPKTSTAYPTTGRASRISATAGPRGLRTAS